MSNEWIIEPAADNKLTVQLPSDIKIKDGTENVKAEQLQDLLAAWFEAHQEDRVASMCCALQQDDTFICESI